MELNNNKLLVYLFVLLPFGLFSQEKIKWISLEDAVYLQQTEPRNIIIDVYTNWCGPCKKLDRETFGNKDLIKYVNDNYYAVKFNAEGNDTIEFQGYEFTNPNFDPTKTRRRNSSHEFTRALQVSAYPTVVFLDKSSNVLYKLRGFQPVPQMEFFLKYLNGKYKEIKTQEEMNTYQNSFVYEFSK